MLSKINSVTVMGIEAKPVKVEVTSQGGLPKEIIVGLPGTVIKESKNRIQSAIKEAGFRYPSKAYTINLAPAELPKEGPFLDLPIAVGILESLGVIESDPDAFYVGELSLSGEIKPIRGMLSICQYLKDNQIKKCYIPAENSRFATYFKELELVPLNHLKDLKKSDLENISCNFPKDINNIFKEEKTLELGDVKGQLMGKRALEIAAAGNHNLLFIGSPGCGKTMLLKRLPYILPKLEIDQAIETLKIRSISQFSSDHILSFSPPFRKPHHSISYAGLVGGGKDPRPGEISLAHLGVLFLDELAEFPRNVVEVLRQPIEDHEVTITRANLTIHYPAKFMLVAAMNPCPCGYYLDKLKKCQCQQGQIQKYWKKVSGPILDRIDIVMELPQLNKNDYFELSNHEKNPFTSQKTKERISTVRSIQKERYKSDLTNAYLSKKELDSYCHLSKDIQTLIGKYIEKGFLSGRSYDKVLKVARTIADLDMKEHIEEKHMLEALQFRKKLFNTV